MFFFPQEYLFSLRVRLDDYNEVPGVIKGKQSLRLRVRKLLVQGHVALLLWASPMHIMVQTSGKTNCLPHELENKEERLESHSPP